MTSEHQYRTALDAEWDRLSRSVDTLLLQHARALRSVVTVRRAEEGTAAVDLGRYADVASGAGEEDTGSAVVALTSRPRSVRPFADLTLEAQVAAADADRSAKDWATTLGVEALVTAVHGVERDLVSADDGLGAHVDVVNHRKLLPALEATASRSRRLLVPRSTSDTLLTLLKRLDRDDGRLRVEAVLPTDGSWELWADPELIELWVAVDWSLVRGRPVDPLDRERRPTLLLTATLAHRILDGPPPELRRGPMPTVAELEAVLACPAPGVRSL